MRRWGLIPGAWLIAALVTSSRKTRTARRPRIFCSGHRRPEDGQARFVDRRWDRPTAIAAPPDRERSRRDRGDRAGSGAQARPEARCRSADRADGRHGDHLEARRPGRDPVHPPAHGRGPGALPDPGGLRRGGDRDRARHLRTDRGRHGGRIRPGADRARRRGWSARQRSGRRSASASRCSSLFAAAAGPIESVPGRARSVGTMVVAGGLTFAIYSIGSTSQAVFMREMRFRSIELRNWLRCSSAASSAIIAAARRGRRVGARPAADRADGDARQRAVVARRLASRPLSSRARVFRKLASFALTDRRRPLGTADRAARALADDRALRRRRRAGSLDLRDEHGDPAAHPDRDPDRRGAVLGLLAPAATSPSGWRPCGFAASPTWRRCCCRSCSG